jgi:putative restriction endonuclease
VVQSQAELALARLSALRQHQQGGKRSPHKPLLALLVLGRLAATGSSRLAWSDAEHELADLIAQFGRPTRTGRRQSAAYPFTRLRADHVWLLDRDVPMDNVGPLDEAPIAGRLESRLEDALREPGVLESAARMLVESQFPSTVAPDVLQAVGLDPDTVLGRGVDPLTHVRESRRRSAAWRQGILQNWDYSCAFCGYDGRLGSAAVGIEAAHVRWFNFGGPDSPDNGLSLCSLHHKLFDRGVLGLDQNHQIVVSERYSARTQTARLVYDLHGFTLAPRPGTPMPADEHLSWHRREVFHGSPISA